MNRCLTKRIVAVISICCFVAVAIGSRAAFTVESEIERAAILARTGKVEEAENILLPLLKQKSTAVQAGYELGLIYYERNEHDQAISSFKDALAASFTEPTTGKLQQAGQLARSGKAKEAEDILLLLLDDDLCENWPHQVRLRKPEQQFHRNKLGLATHLQPFSYDEEPVQMGQQRYGHRGFLHPHDATRLLSSRWQWQLPGGALCA